MKKYILFAFTMLFAWLLPLTAFCQAPDISADQVINLQVYFVSLAAFSGIIVPVTSFVNKWIRLTGAWKQVLSWVVSIALGFAAWFLNLGIFADIMWYWCLLYSVIAALVANGIFDIRMVQAILRLLKLETRN